MAASLFKWLSALGYVHFSTKWIEFLIPITIVATAINNLVQKSGEVEHPSKLPLIYFFALFFGLIAFIIKLIFASGRTLQFLLDLMEGKVTSVTGRMHMSKNEQIEDGLDTLTKQKTETYNRLVNGEYFEIEAEGFDALRDRSGGIYKVWLGYKN